MKIRSGMYIMAVESGSGSKGNCGKLTQCLFRLNPR